MCKSGYSGEDCSFKICHNACSDHGVCQQPQGECRCYPGFAGSDCSQDECPKQCSGNGVCNGGCCDCADGFTGVDCSLPKCPLDCSARGTCNYAHGTCTCYAPNYGAGCEKALPTREDVLPTDEVRDSEQIPVSYTDPFHVFALVYLPLECSSVDVWLEQHQAAVKRVVADVTGMGPFDVDFYSIDCMRVAPSGPKQVVVSVAQGSATGGQVAATAARVVVRVVALGEIATEAIRDRIDAARESGRISAKVSELNPDIEKVSCQAQALVGERPFPTPPQPPMMSCVRIIEYSHKENYHTTVVIRSRLIRLYNSPIHFF